jgi:hypothetical protein
MRPRFHRHSHTVMIRHKDRVAGTAASWPYFLSHYLIEATCLDAPGRRLPTLAIFRALIFASEHKRRGASEHHLAGVQIEEFEHPRLGARDQAPYVFDLCRGKVQRQFRLQLVAPVLVYFESNQIVVHGRSTWAIAQWATLEEDIHRSNLFRNSLTRACRWVRLLLIDKRDIVYR